MSGIVSRLSVLGKVWLGLAAGAMALIIFCLAAPGSSLFFPLVSLWCDLALFAGGVLFGSAGIGSAAFEILHDFPLFPSMPHLHKHRRTATPDCSGSADCNN